MAIVNLNKADLKKIIGNVEDEKIDEILSMFGTAVESISKEKVEVEVAPNRPDMLSQQGLIRALKSYTEKETGLKKYKILPPQKNYKVKISSSVKSIRPCTACAIVKNLSFNDEKIKEIIDIQEKLHTTIGRNRKKVAIGIYPLEKITLPITYTAKKPEQIKFIPLDAEKEMTARQILQKHPTGRDYAHLLEPYNLYPLFIDAKSSILSMPPIINSNETGRITEQTNELFVECSGHNQETLNKVLNIIITTLADQGGQVYQMKINNITTPDLSPEKMKISLDNINKLLGLDLKESALQKLLQKMGYNYSKGKVEIPAWRTDILHEVDIAEDVAIAYGYDKLTPQIPKVATIAQESPESKLKTKISEILIGLGLLEISSYHLIKKDEAELMSLQNKIELQDSKTEYKILRPSLLIPALRILAENKDHEYPQKLFESGIVFSPNPEKETGIQENQNLLIISAPGNFTELKQILDYLTKMLAISYAIEESTHPSLIEGRTASIKINNQEVGYLGELHPGTLKKWGVKMPASVLEISLEEIFNILKS